MIRAFTISFDFEGKTYLALASQHSNGEDVNYSIRLYDEKLQRIIPEGQLTYNGRNGLCPKSLRHPSATRLFTCINSAVTGHLEVCTRNTRNGVS